MYKIGFNVRKIREQKGFSQDFMANQLEISQASYARIESDETRLTIDRLYKIAEILKTDISEFFNASKLNIQNQTNDNGSYANGYVQNLYASKDEIYEKLLQAKDEQIALLKKLLEKL